MSWVRIHDGAIRHPKLVGLVDWKNPFCLWVWGLSYVQEHLTDGVIVKVAIPNPTALKTAQKLIAHKLWREEADVFIVHDYLDWNDSKEVIRKKRAGGNARMAALRSRSHRSVSDASRDAHTPSGVVLRSSDLSNTQIPERESEGKPSAPRPHVVVSAPDDAIAERAAALIETYGELYTKHRKGAKHLQLGSNMDWTQACDLCRTWDDERLRKLIDIFLTTDDEWVSSTARTFRLFVTRASWCDDRLAQWEAKRRPLRGAVVGCPERHPRGARQPPRGG